MASERAGGRAPADHVQPPGRQHQHVRQVCQSGLLRCGGHQCATAWRSRNADGLLMVVVTDVRLLLIILCPRPPEPSLLPPSSCAALLSAGRSLCVPVALSLVCFASGRKYNAVGAPHRQKHSSLPSPASECVSVLSVRPLAEGGGDGGAGPARQHPGRVGAGGQDRGVPSQGRVSPPHPCHQPRGEHIPTYEHLPWTPQQW